jgi:carboxylesterase type B
VPVYAYRFSYVAGSVQGTGAQHATDIPFFFDTAAIKYGNKTTARDRAMGRAMSAYLVNFAKPAIRTAPGCRPGRGMRARQRRDHGLCREWQASRGERSMGNRD